MSYPRVDAFVDLPVNNQSIETDFTFDPACFTQLDLFTPSI